MNKKTQHSVSAGISYILLVLLALVMIYPLLWMAGGAFKSNNEIFGSMNLLPKKPVFNAFREGWSGSGQVSFGKFILNTFALVVPTVLFTVVSSVLVGYGFARFNFPFKRIIFTIMLSTMMLPATVVIIPRYIFFSKLGWLDTYLPFIVPAALGCYPFFTYLMVQFFRGLPMELDESAEMDGCNSFVILVRILLPLCKSAIFSVVIFQFVWTWNDFFNVLIYISSVIKYPVALGLRLSIDIVASNVHWNSLLALSLVSIIPPVVLFFCAQKYFIEGIATTGMKD